MEDLNYIIDDFKDAKEYGSIINVKRINFNKIFNILSNFKLTTDLNRFKYQNEIRLFESILNQSIILSQKYYITITNPPYMGNKGMDSKLNNYLKINFKNTKKDLSTVFMEKSFEFTKKIGFISMINIPVWMFISSYEELRKVILNEKLFINMLHLGRGIFGSDFGTTSFIIRNKYIPNYNSTFKQLYEDKGAVDSISKKEKMFFNDENNFIMKQCKFIKIPGNSIAYWVSDKFIDTFEKGICIDDISGHTGSQNKTADNEKYLRYFWEVSNEHVGIDNKWIFYAKGGDFKKYYGNLEHVVDWSEDARNFYKNNPTSNLLDEKYWYQEGITYTKISSKGVSFRYLPKNCVFDMGGPSICYLGDNLLYILGLLNSNLANFYLNIFNPTINIQSKDIRALPIIINNSHKNRINKLVKSNLEIAKGDYESFETSFSFKKHFFVSSNECLIENILDNLTYDKLNQLNQFISNEVLLNEIFLEIYDVHDVSSKINEEDIKLNLFNYDESIKSFISYAVGCMFGRYSLDNEGLQFAGGVFNIDNYIKFIPDDDNIIPVLDSEYFEDDIVNRFVEFVKTCFGEETLEENLDFIANALAKNKKSSREKIRDYLLKNFFNDHKKTYKKCPIYWQFSSGKENGFNCLVYMHRYEPSLVARIRTDYLHKTQKAIEQAIANCDNIINHSSSKQEVVKATKDKANLQKQLKETQEYDEALAHIANQNIEIDLDDGVKVNYAKFQNVQVSKEGKKSKKINLLKKL